MSANATARAVLQRMAAPLRHELAGALLVPQMQLQMLQRQLAQDDVAQDPGALSARIAEVLESFAAVRELHLQIGGWLAGSDDTPCRLDDCVHKMIAVLTLPYAVGGLELGLQQAEEAGAHEAPLLPALTYAMQPLGLLLGAAFFFVQDALHARCGRVSVALGVEAGQGWVEWRFVPTEAEEESAPVDVPPPGAHIDPVGLAALAKLHGMRFAADMACWRLDLGAPRTDEHTEREAQV